MDHDLDQVGEDAGLRDFEGRSFRGWHRHITLASAAHAIGVLSGAAVGRSGAARPRHYPSTFVLAPEDHAYENPHDRAYVDAGYLDHERYLAEAAGRLTPGGRVLLHFSDRGDLGRLRELARLHGRRLRLLACRRDRDGAETVGHLLYEVAPR